jgi:4,5-DOPA dioxygenase extradiol
VGVRRSTVPCPHAEIERDPEAKMSVTHTLFPTIFVSHGAPDILLHASPAREFLSELGRSLPVPRAVVCASAHWTTNEPSVDSAAQPRTIHDFGGFPDELYRIRYPAPGSPELAHDVFDRLATAGVPALVTERGLDHGAWVPLRLMYPEANVPIVQLALQPHLGAAHHHALGRALEKLRHEGVLVLASGGATHNLGELGSGDIAPDWVRAFDDWLVERAAEGDAQALVDYRKLAPDARRNHPTEEHFLPLHVALGAAGEGARGTVLHRSVQYGTLSMTALRFDAA